MLICGEGERAVDEASPFPRGFERGISGSERVHVAEDSMSVLAFWYVGPEVESPSTVIYCIRCCFSPNFDALFFQIGEPHIFGNSR
jgi:hypothetical protein